MQFQHETVFENTLVDHLSLRPGDIAVDCTAGGGGHTRIILDKVGEGGRVFALDQDESAISHLQHRFQEEINSGRLTLCHMKFSAIGALAAEHGLTGKIKAICADVGVSSPQLDTPERGFSFMKDGPLDMTMSKTYAQQSAEEIINTFGAEELAKIFRDFGEEPQAWRIAQAILSYRQKTPITRTLQLADLIKATVKYNSHSKKHPATKVFQALRIFVNNELEELSDLIEEGFEALAQQGRMGIISFHSLEDRIVKNRFNDYASLLAEKNVPRHLPIAKKEPRAAIVRPFPMMPDEIEQKENIRSRSAKLRVIEKL
jgi:16S rRNA (cytosine1402-N4)-methyltransferase